MRVVGLKLSGTCLIAATLTSGAAFAEPVRVRTGDHETFTRIVIDFAVRPDWSLNERDSSYRIMTRSSRIQYDLSNSFARIDRTRVDSIEQDSEGNLVFQVACNCKVISEELSNEGLLIDIIDIPAFDTEPGGIGLKSQSNKGLPLLQTEIYSEVGQSYGFSVFAADGVLLQKIVSTEIQNWPGLKYKTRSDKLKIRKNGSGENSVSNTKDVLRKDSVALPPSSSVSLMPTDRLKILKNINISDPVNINSKLNAEIYSEMTIDECPADDLVDITKWNRASSTEPGFSDLFNAKGGLNPETHLQYARQLIYSSFGLEARSLLSNMKSPAPESGLVIAQAELIDGLELSQDMDLTHFASCDTSASLWGVLAIALNDRTSPINLEALLRTFSGLPIHLRILLGPRIVDVLLARDARSQATEIRNAIMRGSDPAVVPNAVVRLSLERGSGGLSQSTPFVSRIAQPANLLALEAIDTLLQTGLDRNEVIQTDDLEIATILAFENRKIDSGQNLLATVGRVHLRQRNFAEAWKVLQELGDGTAIDNKRKVIFYNNALEQLALASSDSVFLNIFAAEDMDHTVETRVREVIAERLRALSLPSAAKDVLGPIIDLPTKRERSIMDSIALLESRTGADLELAADSSLGVTIETSQLVSPPAPSEPVTRAINAASMTQLASGRDMDTFERAPDIARGTNALATSRELRDQVRAFVERSQ